MQSCRLPRLGDWPANLPLRFALGLISPRFLPRLVFGPETSGKVLGTTDVPSSPWLELSTPLGGVYCAAGW